MSPLDAASVRPLEGGPSFSLSNRLTRLSFIVVWLVLARWTPRVMNPWRVFLLRLFGARIAPGAMIYSSVRVWLPSNLEMAEQASLGPGVDCYNMDLVRIGAYTVISQRAVLCAGTHAIGDRNFQLVTRPIVIGERAWVAAEAFVGPGVSIGDEAVLGARACAFGHLDPRGVYVGNPAHKIKERKLEAL
jgi:putative colanic acid biosynthesis acetyltransferase WcaF